MACIRVFNFRAANDSTVTGQMRERSLPETKFVPLGIMDALPSGCGRGSGIDHHLVNCASRLRDERSAGAGRGISGTTMVSVPVQFAPTELVPVPGSGPFSTLLLHGQRLLVGRLLDSDEYSGNRI